MNPYLAYKKPEPTADWTRIDLLLALYDKALDRLDGADAALRAGDTAGATGALIKVQLILNALASGVDVDVAPERGTNTLRLYEYAANELRTPRAEGITNARNVLRTLRQGFEAVRAEANELERKGVIPPAEQAHLVRATV
ncbi:hypothetical protein, partial : : FliS [Gemmataceae bacterium]